MKTLMKGGQGDVRFRRIDAMPTALVELETNIVAEGEATGHAHRLYGGATLFEEPITKQRFLRVIEGGAELRHTKSDGNLAEHHPVQIPPGIYEIGIVRETDHIAGIIRKAVD